MVEHEATDRLHAVATEILSRFGLVVEDLRIRENQGAAEVTLVVDLPEDRTGSVQLDTVADASRALSERLDEDESLLGPGPSLLEITTPGAERELTAPRHFRRSRGRLLSLVLEDGTALRARLLDVDADAVLTLRPEPGADDRGRPRKIPAGIPEILRTPSDQVRSARAEIEFSPPPDLAELTDPSGSASGTDSAERSARPSSAADDSEP